MKANDIRERDTESLKTLEAELSKELWKSRFDNHTNQLDGTHNIGRLRREIARVKTVLAERARASKTA
jgi:large subunit ribosomal protein L29